MLDSVDTEYFHHSFGQHCSRCIINIENPKNSQLAARKYQIDPDNPLDTHSSSRSHLFLVQREINISILRKYYIFYIIMKYLHLGESICGQDGTSRGPLLTFSWVSLRLPTCSHLSVGLWVLLRTAEAENFKVGGLVSSRWLLGTTGRRKEEQKFLQKCFKSSEVKY